MRPERRSAATRPQRRCRAKGEHGRETLAGVQPQVQPDAQVTGGQERPRRQQAKQQDHEQGDQAEESSLAPVLRGQDRSAQRSPGRAFVQVDLARAARR
jgi:hypothetical protein